MKYSGARLFFEPMIISGRLKPFDIFNEKNNEKEENDETFLSIAGGGRRRFYQF